MASWNRRYLRDFARISEPHRKLTEKDTPFQWTDECQTAWDTIIEAIATTRGISYPDWELPFFENGR